MVLQRFYLNANVIWLTKLIDMLNVGHWTLIVSTLIKEQRCWKKQGKKCNLPYYMTLGIHFALFVVISWMWFHHMIVLLITRRYIAYRPCHIYVNSNWHVKGPRTIMIFMNVCLNIVHFTVKICSFFSFYITIC